MTVTAPTKRAARRQTSAERRVGYVIAALINAALLYLANVWPGWQAVPFLTGETTEVLPWVNTSILTGIAANVLYLAFDRRWLKALGDIVTTAVGLVAMARIWDVFPFDFSGMWSGWPVVARWVLVVGMVGSAIAILVNVVTLVRGTPSRA